MKHLIVALALAVVLALGRAPRAAGAHAAFITSSPAPDSVVDALPDQLRIVFSSAVLADGTTVTVTAPDGVTIVSGDLTITDNVVTTPLTSAGPGVYVVSWTNIAAEDGHPSADTFQFTLSG